MQRTLLTSKLHRACVSQAELNYEGSCAIDTELLALAGIVAYEELHIYNINNGERFSTYAIEASPGSKTISINGAAARKVQVGDRLIICTYGLFNETELSQHQPHLVYLDETNQVTDTSHAIPIQTDQTSSR